MNNTIVRLKALSLKEFEKAITAKAEKALLEKKNIALSISDPKIIVRQFELPVLAHQELKKSLILEAVELLSLSPRGIIFDFQIFSKDARKIRGVFVAMSKNILMKYCDVVTKLKAEPFSVTADILSSANIFLTKTDLAKKSFSLLDFARPGMVYLVLFNAGCCELLREIRYDNISEAREEILHSLRYGLGKSSSKESRELFFSGDYADKNKLMAEIENEFSVKSRAIDLSVEGGSKERVKNYFKINLIKPYVLPLAWRRFMHYFFDIVIGLLCLGILLLYFENSRLAIRLKELKAQLPLKAQSK